MHCCEPWTIASSAAMPCNRKVVIERTMRTPFMIDTPRQSVVLTATGRRVATATPDGQAAIWRQQLLQLRLFRIVHDAARTRPDRTIDRDFVLETIVTRMPSEDYELVFNTFVRWARFGALFAYDAETHRLRLIE